MKTSLLIAAIAAGFALTLTPAHAQEREMVDFAMLDANGDGQITPDELTANKAARFEAADVNGDGALSADELAARVTAMAEDRAANRVARMIAHLDENEDGVLQQSELDARGGDRAARRFDRADRDDNGSIDAEEFEQVQERAERRGGKGKRRGGGRADRG